MKKGNRKRKFGREKAQRTAMLKSLAENLILNGRIKTTETRAKELRSFVEVLITKAKKQNLHSFRYIRKQVSAPSSRKLFKDWGSRYRERPGGYLRIIKLPRRISDGAKMAHVEFV